jgi:hypothetical protein
MPFAAHLAKDCFSTKMACFINFKWNYGGLRDGVNRDYSTDFYMGSQTSVTIIRASCIIVKKDAPTQVGLVHAVWTTLAIFTEGRSIMIDHWNHLLRFPCASGNYAIIPLGNNYPTKVGFARTGYACSYEVAYGTIVGCIIIVRSWLSQN